MTTGAASRGDGTASAAAAAVAAAPEVAEAAAVEAATSSVAAVSADAEAETPFAFDAAELLEKLLAHERVAQVRALVEANPEASAAVAAAAGAALLAAGFVAVRRLRSSGTPPAAAEAPAAAAAAPVPAKEDEAVEAAEAAVAAAAVAAAAGQQSHGIITLTAIASGPSGEPVVLEEVTDASGVRKLIIASDTHDEVPLGVRVDQINDTAVHTLDDARRAVALVAPGAQSVLLLGTLHMPLAPVAPEVSFDDAPSASVFLRAEERTVLNEQLCEMEKSTGSVGLTVTVSPPLDTAKEPAAPDALEASAEGGGGGGGGGSDGVLQEPTLPQMAAPHSEPAAEADAPAAAATPEAAPAASPPQPAEEVPAAAAAAAAETPSPLKASHTRAASHGVKVKHPASTATGEAKKPATVKKAVKRVVRTVPKKA